MGPTRSIVPLVGRSAEDDPAARMHPAGLDDPAMVDGGERELLRPEREHDRPGSPGSRVTRWKAMSSRTGRATLASSSRA